MNKLRKTKVIVDLLMTLTLLLLMGYIFTGDLAHEIAGTFMIILWIVHNLLNRSWYPSLFKGRYSPKRVIQIILNSLLFLSMIGLIASGIILSSYVFTFLDIKGGTAFARRLHMLSSYWCFLLSSLHLGVHWGWIASLLKKSDRIKEIGWQIRLIQVLLIIVSFYGIYAFIKQALYLYLFLQVSFVYFYFNQSVFSFFNEYAAMMIMFASLSYYLTKFIKNTNLKRFFVWRKS